MLRLAGFTDVRFHGWTGYRTSDHTQGAEVSASKPSMTLGSTLKRRLTGSPNCSTRRLMTSLNRGRLETGRLAEERGTGISGTSGGAMTGPQAIAYIHCTIRSKTSC